MTQTATSTLLPDGQGPTPGAAVDLVLARVADFLAAESARWAATDAELGVVPKVIADYVARGGKRLRPSFLLAATLAAGGDPRAAAAIDAGAALELLHAFALIHDDIMDGSMQRRGAPALHVDLSAAHAAAQFRGESRRFDEGMAVLVGDLALVYADRLMPRHEGVRDLWDELRIELTMGQHLDLTAAASGDRGPSRARRIADLKSGRYTVVRPLHLGAALTNRFGELQGVLQRYGQPVGQAFQLRDDLLGLFGDPETTGKPTGDDLREGKATFVLAVAHERANSRQRRVLDLVGRADLQPDDVDRLRELIRRTGAVAIVEHTIDDLLDQGVAALGDPRLAAEGRAALESLAVNATRRMY